MRRPVRPVLLAFALGSSLPSWADTLQVAVAANFTAPFQALAPLFEQATGHQAVGAFAATGQLYAQIRHGAPFEVLLSADSSTPRRLIEEGEGVAASRFTYATGKLVLWSAQPDYLDGTPAALHAGKFRHLAIANPQTAPYGLAALQTLEQLGLREHLAERLVEGQSISQTQQFIASGNAELGFIALAQVYRDGRISSGSAWQVPANLHTPLHQDALLLNRGRDNPAAQAWLDFLQSPQAAEVIRAFGYDLAD